MAENEKPKESVKQILAEDEDKTVDAGEIERIFRIYLGRPATEDETARFEGLRESEWKILQKYVEKQADIAETDEKNRIESTKNAQDFAVKDAKITGNKILEAKKAVPGGMPTGMTPGPGMVAPSTTFPAQPNPEMPSTTGPAETGGQKYLQDGENFLVQFK